MRTLDNHQVCMKYDWDDLNQMMIIALIVSNRIGSFDTKANYVIITRKKG